MYPLLRAKRSIRRRKTAFRAEGQSRSFPQLRNALVSELIIGGVVLVEACTLHKRKSGCATLSARFLPHAWRTHNKHRPSETRPRQHFPIPEHESLDLRQRPPDPVPRCKEDERHRDEQIRAPQPSSLGVDRGDSGSDGGKDGKGDEEDVADREAESTDFALDDAEGGRGFGGRGGRFGGADDETVEGEADEEEVGEEGEGREGGDGEEEDEGARANRVAECRGGERGGRGGVG